MKKHLAIFVFVMMMLFLLAGCSGNAAETANNSQSDAGSESVNNTNSASESEEAEASSSEAEVEEAAEEAEKRTDIVIAIDSDISTLHPSNLSTSNETDIEAQIYDTLMRITLDGSTPPQPRIAKSYTISEDGLTYTFELREDVTFHNGTPLTAEDVKFSAELYQESIYQNSMVTGLKEIEIIDDYTIAFTTETVYSPFLDNIADIHIASKAYFDSVSEDEFSNNPIGAGPYKFVSHDLGTKVVLQAYEDYYLGEAGIKDITFKVLPDDTTVAVALRTGEIDFASISETNFSNLDGVEGIVIENIPFSRFGFVTVNHEKYPYSEVKFRQAIAYAIDRQNMVDLALEGIGTPNSNILSPLRFGYSEDQPVYDYNPEKSKELLAELGIETPYDLGTLYVAESYSMQAQILQNDLAYIGLDTTIEILEFNAYLSKLMNGDFGISVLAMSLEGSTQQYELAFKSDYIGAANNARYNNPEIGELFDQAVAAIDEQQRFDIYNEIFTKVQEEAVYIVMYNTEGLYAHNDTLKCHPFVLEGRYYIYDFSW